jgi:smad nuclear-interacting protein 1
MAMLLKSSGIYPLRIVTQIRPYIIDLESTNGTKLNEEKMDARRYIRLKTGDVIQFGESTREYVFIKDPDV